MAAAAPARALRASSAYRFIARWELSIANLRFIIGVRKACLACQHLYRPWYRIYDGGDRFEMARGRYNSQLFCSRRCDDDYVKGALRRWDRQGRS